MTEKPEDSSSMPEPPRYTGRIESCNERNIRGWIRDSAAPAAAVMLDLVVNGRVVATQRADHPRETVLTSGIRRTMRNGFDFTLAPELFSQGTLTLALFVSGCDQQVLGPAVVITPYDVALGSVVTACERLNQGASDTGIDRGYWARTQILSKVLQQLRRSRTLPQSITIDLKPLLLPYPGVARKASTVDLIVPVYRGRAETIDCIEAVLRSRNEAEIELTVINDASPDEELADDLRALRDREGFVLVEHDRNRGFVATVNRALQRHPDRDVILLNSDTVVPPGDWVDRLRRAAYSAPNIGTVTPFSDNAEICSFPHIGIANDWPEEISIADLDALFAECNAGVTVDLPTAVGFCMFIRREALDEAGSFDERRWGRGYGEENDFCLKAAALGWRHVAACDLFVRHRGSVSFGAEKKRLAERHLAQLNEIYPDYSAVVHRFVLHDPLRCFRQRVILRLFQRHADRFFLFVMHTLGGGSTVAAEFLARRLALEGCAVLELAAGSGRDWTLQCFGLPYRLQYRLPDDWTSLLDDLRSLGIRHIHYHQTLFFSREVFELPEQLGVDYDWTAHDHLPICPRITMIDETGGYCGDSQFSAETCDRCIRYNGFDEHADLGEKFAAFGGHVASWRSIHERFLKGARTVFFPSEDTVRRFRRHIALSNAVIQPHPEQRWRLRPREHRSQAPFPIALIGGIGRHKGFDILLQCALSARKEGLPLRFVVFGYSSDDEALVACGNVEITGPYQPDDLAPMVERSGCSIAAFLGPAPETFSFTLSEAWRMGLFPVAFDHGAIGERISKVGFGRLLPVTRDPKAINAALLEAAQSTHAVNGSLTVGTDCCRVLHDYYRLE